MPAVMMSNVQRVQSQELRLARFLTSEALPSSHCVLKNTFGRATLIQIKTDI